MIRFAVSRSFVVLSLGCLVCFASAQKSFVRPHALEVDGALIGIAWDLTGGQPGADRFENGVPISGPQNLDALFSLYGNGPVFAWAKNAMQGNTGQIGPTIYPISKYVTPCNSSDWYSLVGIEFPGCDSDSKDSGGISMRIKSKTYQKKADQQIASKGFQEAAKKQKMWMVSNFRVSIGDLPNTRISKIDPIVFRQVVGDFDGDGSPDARYPANSWKFTLGRIDAAAYQAAFNSTLAGAPKDYLFQLDYLDEAGNMLVGLRMNAQVVGFGPTNPFADPADPEFTYTVTLSNQKGGEVVFNPMSG